MKPKRVYFFAGDKFVQYGARNDVVDHSAFPADVAPAWPGLSPAGFAAGVDAVLNAGNGFVYFFLGDSYVRVDPRTHRVDQRVRKIADGWPALSASGFDHDLDAALYYRDGKALFFKGGTYLRYHIATDKVDAGYPKDISAGWLNIAAPFTSGIDAAVNWGEGKAYFFKGGKYVRVTIATNSVDAGYPLDTAVNWPALPASFTSGVGDVVEWPYCEAAGLGVTLSPAGCTQEQTNPGEVFPVMRVHQMFVMVGAFSAPEHPADCRAGEYRQYVRGDHIVNGERRPPLLTAAGEHVRPRPQPGAADDNFREDSVPRASSISNLHYGHRDELPGNADTGDRYDPVRVNGCTYRGIDTPFVDGLPGQSFLLDLDFKATLIDVCNDNEVMASHTWQVFCPGTFNVP